METVSIYFEVNISLVVHIFYETYSKTLFGIKPVYLNTVAFKSKIQNLTNLLCVSKKKSYATKLVIKQFKQQMHNEIKQNQK